MPYKKLVSFLFLLPSIGFADPALEDPCDNFLALINRPSYLDSPCSVKPGEVVVEMGYQYLSLHSESGNSRNYPEAVFRFGLPLANEFIVIAPNYMDEHISGEDPITGSNATSLGFKHQFPIINNKWIYAAEGYVTLPSGNDNFGSEGTGVLVIGIVSYSILSNVSATVMLSLASETVAPNSGGERYTTLNPDFLVSWQTTEDSQLYIEIYGQTKTSPDQGDGYNADGGIQYLLTPNIEVDLEYGWRLSGDLEGYSHYIGFGGGVRF